MNTAEKICIAKDKWNLSFESLAFILEMDKKEVAKIYHNEMKKRHLNQTIRVNDEISVLIGGVLSQRVCGLLYRKTHVRTIKQLLEYENDDKRFGEKTIGEIAAAQEWIKSVLKKSW